MDETQEFTLLINGEEHKVSAHAEMPLLWALRQEVGLAGTKFGCGEGLCGACTVHINGEATRSCQVPVGEVDKVPVTTIEGLAKESVGRKLEAAWLEVDVMQCGYCQSGQLMSALALLKRTPRPSLAEIDAAMEGNLCRCATYNRIRQAIRKASGQGGKA
ncbi:MAG: (2Fe-2S)-binding protein [Novosphingobium sp.]